MNNLFNPDNRFFTLVGKIVDVIILGVVFLIFCIPVITIGPACTALYYVTVKVIRRERGYLFREFLKSFKLNFKRAAIVGVFLTVATVIIVVDLLTTWATFNTGVGNNILFGVYIAVAVLLFGFFIYVFPVLSRFELTIKQLIKTVFIISIRHFPSTLAMIIITVAAYVFLYYMPFFAILMPGALTFVNSFIMERVLKKYMPATEDTEGESKKDEWYLE